MVVITYYRDDDGTPVHIPVNIDLYALDDTTLRLRHWFMSDELRTTIKILNRALLHTRNTTPQGRNLSQLAKRQRTAIKNHLSKIEVLICTQ